MQPILLNQLSKRAIGSANRVDAVYGEMRIESPAQAADLARAEERLGFVLPCLLREIYLNVANGGFGPGYGLLGIEGGATDDMGRSIEVAYLDAKRAFGEKWPDKLLPVSHRGCGIYFCLNCAVRDGEVVEFQPADLADNELLWKQCFVPVAASMEEWLKDWLQRT